MEVSDRIYYLDGVKITEPGTYYYNEFKVSESQVGYDPATIDTWFVDGNESPDLSNADILAKFTMSYNYTGINCCVHTSISIHKEIKFEGWGAIQQ